MKKLPIGIQTFSKIIKDNCVYVDKTRHIAEIIESGEYFFLSRPRRFGKSLLVSTLSEIFSGNRNNWGHRNNWGQSKIKPNYQSFYQSFCCPVFLAKFILL